MEFEELKNKWNRNDHSEEVKISAERVNELTLRKSRKVLSEFRLENLVEMFIYLLLISYLWDFMRDHLTEAKFLIPAIILFLLSGVNVVFNFYALDFFGKLNLSTPVLELQKRLERIRWYIKWESYLMIVLIPFTIIPFFIVMAKGLLGLDLYPLIMKFFVQIVVPWALIGTIIVWVLSRSDRRRLKKLSQSLREMREFED